MTTASMTWSRAADRARLTLSAYWDAAYRGLESGQRLSPRSAETTDAGLQSTGKETAGR